MNEADINWGFSEAGGGIDFPVWIADLTYTQQTVAADVMPNAIGGIATFTEKVIDVPEAIRLFKYPERLVEALNERGPPRVMGFSNYIWNFSLSLEFARVIKEHAPDTVIVFGGPNYPVVADEQETFLQRHRVIDFYVIKEGELAFARLLDALAADAMDVEKVKRRRISSVHAIGADGTPYLSDTIDRIRDLTEIPSPYASGRLDEFFDGVLLPIVQTNRGCPFGCTFCVEGVRYYNKVYRNSADKLAQEFDYIGDKMARLRESGGRNDLFIADSNFAMYRDDLDTCRELAKTREKYGWPECINVATGKNKKERVLEASKIIDGALRLSGSVQSLDETVLKNIKRDNISADALMGLALDANEIGANSYSEIILGLPGDSKEAHFKTVKTVMDAGFTNIYLFQLMLLPGTDMHTEASKREYGMTCRYRVLPRCYGHFEVLGQRIVAAEIEEICVANDTLSFDDYLACRKFHLIVTIFHNDGVFGSVLKLLRLRGVSVFRWMELLTEASVDGGLGRLFADFAEATKNELWDIREDLAAFVREPRTVENFIAGQLGNNLLFVHKTLAITQHVDQLVDLARVTLCQCMAEAGEDDAATMAFIDDALLYHQKRMSNLFADLDAAPEATLSFGIQAFEEAASPSAVADFAFDRPKTYAFVLEPSQRELIERYMGIYGDSTVGIGRILSKVHVRKLFRHPFTGDEHLGRESEQRYHIAGLQH